MVKQILLYFGLFLLIILCTAESSVKLKRNFKEFTQTKTLNTDNCDGRSSCSPSFCVDVSNSACVDPNAGKVITNVEVQNEMTKIGCRQCTQSSNFQCTADYLTKAIKSAPSVFLAYCNDGYLVLHTSGEPSHTDGLASVPKPPAGGQGNYSALCVTRTFHQQNTVYKVPLNPVALSTSSKSNNVGAFAGQTNPGILPGGIGLPISGPCAVTTNGLNLFPLFNNNGEVSHEFCELDKCNAHAGMGFDYHYHGDPYSNVSGRCLYSDADYASATVHPPLIGWSLDGFSIYGRHLKTTNEGQSIALDDCGGHVHGTYAYHYHGQVVSYTSKEGKPYNAYIGGVHNCWKGDISLTKFFDQTGPLEKRADYQELRPCCLTPQFYAKSGMVLNGAIFNKSSTANTNSSSTLTIQFVGILILILSILF